LRTSQILVFGPHSPGLRNSSAPDPAANTVSDAIDRRRHLSAPPSLDTGVGTSCLCDGESQAEEQWRLRRAAALCHLRRRDCPRAAAPWKLWQVDLSATALWNHRPCNDLHAAALSNHWPRDNLRTTVPSHLRHASARCHLRQRAASPAEHASQDSSPTLSGTCSPARRGPPRPGGVLPRHCPDEVPPRDPHTSSFTELLSSSRYNNMASPFDHATHWDIRSSA
jgi:hypothetical protein